LTELGRTVGTTGLGAVRIRTCLGHVKFQIPCRHLSGDVKQSNRQLNTKIAEV
jgi:hypothetical protein